MEAIIMALATFPEAKKEDELKKLKRITLSWRRQKPQRPYFAASLSGRLRSDLKMFVCRGRLYCANLIL